MPKTNRRRTKRARHSLSRKNIFRSIENTGKKVIPHVSSGLQYVGTNVKTAAEKTAPVVEKGISGVYGALATGFDMGIKGVNNVVSNKNNKRRSRHHKRKQSHRKRS